ncbi:MAG: protein kinase [Clostridia bacterium]|nr:protein kinase [Clostridia bacterium]
MAEYTDIGFLDLKKNVRLTKNNDGVVFVKKYISPLQRNIYEHIRMRNYAGVPRVVDIYPENDYFILIEEYIQGKSLQQMLDEKIPFYPEFVREIAKSLSRTLEPIHRDGIIHRDITASNVIFAGGNNFYLIDFGNARTYKAEQSTDTEYIGTQNYAAPEQFGFGQSDKRTDIYSIGVLINVLLTGGFFTYEKRYKGKLDKVIKKCTRVNPRGRYKNMRALRRGLWREYHKPFLSIPALFIYFLLTFWVALGFITAIVYKFVR